MEKKDYRLPKEFAEKWIAALRSGEYKQISEKLSDNVGFCCLGVACIIGGNKIEDLYDKYFITPHSGFMVPDELSHIKGADDLGYLLARMNDAEGKSFSEIADWIEENVELY